RPPDRVAVGDVVLAPAGGARPVTGCERHRVVEEEQRRPPARRVERMTGVRPRRGRGLRQASHRSLVDADWPSLPDGAVVVVGGRPAVVRGAEVRTFAFDGWGQPSTSGVSGPDEGREPGRCGEERSSVGGGRGGEPGDPSDGVLTRPSSGEARVVTPPTSVLALRHGFRPVLHASATR
ncbi:MAG: hypothetical protein ACRCY9_19080, partial [Phycicoccus sp.]